MMIETQFHPLPDGRQIAFRHTPPKASGTGSAVVFLPGYMSDMAGSKATAIFDLCAATGRECLLLDYSGCGESRGDFADGSLSRWQEEVCALIDAHVECDRIVVAGSSMGGWLMLLVGLQLGARLAGLVGIASAPDFSDWGFSAEQKAQLKSGQTIYKDNPYGYDPTPTHSLFWNDAAKHELLDAPIALNCPVRLLHGQVDTDVAPDTSLRLAAALASDDVQVTLVKGGDHRLSRDTDIALLLRTLEILA
ncbi:alpha/beta hydrolase [Aurantiacibacter atlanticus]|uniref:Palmitoyl-protein thioesterase ABHD10, mitochondrial n=2 Tax=Aurantiacibacter atlanticus TaxID=1648404 RepID=A0A0H4V8T3_9SPHN|nr:alpha/beta hydrolase [Aurantiacibacter atlanticus]